MSIKKYVIRILIILIILIINIMFVQKNSVSANDFISQGKNFLVVGENEYNVVNKEVLQGTSKSIFKVLLSMAICISVIIGAILGFQFILGSVEGKAKVSEALVPYIVGCVIVFGAFTIWEIVVNIGNNVESAVTAANVTKETDEETKRDEIRNKYQNWEDWYLQVVKGGKITNADAIGWDANEWYAFYNWMEENNQVTYEANKINNILIPDYIKEQQEEKDKSKEIRFDAWYASVQSSLNNPNMPSETKTWSKEKWHNFYDWMFNNGGIYYPIGGEIFYKQLKSYINLNKEDDGGDNNIIIEEPISIEDQQFKSWYSSVTSHLNQIEPAEARSWTEDQWRGFYEYMRNTLNLQRLDIPSPGSDFNRYLSDYIKTLR